MATKQLQRMKDENTAQVKLSETKQRAMILEQYLTFQMAQNQKKSQQRSCQCDGGCPICKNRNEGEPNTSRPLGRKPNGWYESWTSKSQRLGCFLEKTRQSLKIRIRRSAYGMKINSQ